MSDRREFYLQRCPLFSTTWLFNCCRTCGRGDEFLCLRTVARNEANIASTAEEIVAPIQAPCDVRVDDVSVSLRINASIGIAIFPKDGTTADALIKSADKAMYQAKRDPRS
jgi:diguanylate cyclase (GGDEF)-like protein